MMKKIFISGKGARSGGGGAMCDTLDLQEMILLIVKCTKSEFGLAKDIEFNHSTHYYIILYYSQESCSPNLIYTYTPLQLHQKLSSWLLMRINEKEQG